MATRDNKIVTLPARIRIRRDTLANWTSINPVLADGELAIVRMPDGSITMRVGTGRDSFKNLPDISNSGADDIHVLDSVTIDRYSGNLSTSDYELCTNNNVIGIKESSDENTSIYLFYKIMEDSSGSYGFTADTGKMVLTILVEASKVYQVVQTVIPDSLEISGNTVKLNNNRDTGVSFDLTKNDSGKVQITLNGASVGTGIILPGHAVADIEGLQAALDGKANTVHTHVHTDVTDFDTSVDSRIDAKLDGLPEVTIPEYTLEKSGDRLSLKKDGAVVGNSIPVAKGKLLDSEGNEIFNADQSTDVRITFISSGTSTELVD